MARKSKPKAEPPLCASGFASHEWQKWGRDRRYKRCRVCGAAVGPQSRGLLPREYELIQAAPVLLLGPATPPVNPESRKVRAAWRRWQALSLEDAYLAEQGVYTPMEVGDRA